MTDFSVENLHALLEWSPMVVGCEPAIERYTELGHKLDVALVHLPHLERWRMRLEDQYPVRLFGFSDNAFLESGLMYLHREHHRAVNVLTEEEVVDEVIAQCTGWLSVLDVVVFTETKRYLLINAPGFKKWVPAGSELQARSMQGRVTWLVAGSDREGSFSSQTLTLTKAVEGEVNIACDRPPFAVIEKL